MITLGIETATRVTSVGLISEAGFLGEENVRPGTGHQQCLMSLVEELVSRLRIKLGDIAVFGCGIGPGSFTGLRVGISTAQGLALGTGRALIGVPTMDVLARNIAHPEYRVCTVIDARRDEVYAAVYTPRKGLLVKIMQETVLRMEALLEKLKGQVIFVGDALEKYGAMVSERMGNRAHLAPQALAVPRGLVVAELAQARFLGGEHSHLGKLKPMYVRMPDAEQKWKESKHQRLKSAP